MHSHPLDLDEPGSLCNTRAGLTCTQQEICRRRVHKDGRNLCAASERHDGLAEEGERLRVAVKVRREAADEEQLGYLARAVLNDPLHGDRTEEASLGADTHGREQRLVAQYGDDRPERRLKEL